MRITLPLLLLVVAVAAAGCGSSSDKTSAPTATTSAADMSAAKKAATETSITGSLEGDRGDCKELAELGQKFSKAVSNATPSSPSEAVAQIKTTAKALEDFADQAPDAVKNDFKVFATTMSHYADAIGDIDLKSGQAPSNADLKKLTEAAQKFNAAEFRQAVAHLTAWSQKNCGRGFGTK